MLKINKYLPGLLFRKFFLVRMMNNINNSVLEKVIVTNTTPKKEGEENIDKITRLSVGNKIH